jgi:ATP-dependent DNA helicase RecG
MQDGFRLAEVDLELRGPGEVLGVRQSGLPEFAFADPIRQPELLARARQVAFDLVARDPGLASPASRELVAGLHHLFGPRRSLASVG